MKNLFKNLMLVAVAAMAFTACTETNDEVNAVSKITRYEFTANIADDTRSGFAEKEEGATAYKSEWFGGETLKIFVTDYTTYSEETTATINKEGKFTLELENAPESFFATVVSPAESWASESTSTIPAEQTPLANTVDPKAHLLQSSPMPVSGGQASINLTHAAAYGKMTVNGVGFAIDHIVVDLKGSYYGSARELSYTINATNVENNTFWFATEPIDVAEFTVTAYGAGDDEVVAKTVDVAAAEKTLSFSYGRVGTFSVSGLEEIEEDTYPVFTSAKWTNAPNYDKTIQFWGDNGIDMILNFSNCNYDNFFDLGEYTIVPNGTGPWKIYGSYSPTWCIYHDAEGNEYGLYGGTVNIDLVGREYVIEFIDLQLIDGFNNPVGTLPYAKFTGDVENMQVPDNRTALDIPSNVQATVSGKTITLTWDPVEHADGYQVKMWNPEDEAKTEIVTGASYVFEAQKGNTMYNFNVYSYASDDNPTYKTSTNWNAISVKTEDVDPKIVLDTNTIQLSAEGEPQTVTVTLVNMPGVDFTYENTDWISVERTDDDTLTISASAYEDGREGTIVITAGELTATINVTQLRAGASAALFVSVETIDGGIASNYSTLLFTTIDGKEIVCDLNHADYVLTYNYSSQSSSTAGTFFNCQIRNVTGVPVLKYDVSTLNVEDDGDNYKFTFDFVFSNDYTVKGTQSFAKSLF